MRLTVGSLVLYEADPLRAALRGERLVGVVLEDLGPGMGASGKQFKVGGQLGRGQMRLLELGCACTGQGMEASMGRACRSHVHVANVVDTGEP